MAWVLVQTENGFTQAFLDVTHHEVADKTTMPSNADQNPIKSKQVSVAAKSSKWKDSGIALAENQVAKITVLPNHDSWSINGKTNISYQGSGSGVDTRTLVPRLHKGCLAVKDGDRNVYGFERGVEQLWIRSPGRIAFACNDVGIIKVPFMGPPKSGYADNKGEVEVLIEVFPRESSNESASKAQ